MDTFVVVKFVWQCNGRKIEKLLLAVSVEDALARYKYIEGFEVKLRDYSLIKVQVELEGVVTW